LFTVGRARPQNGHWKSENSTIVTGAFTLPRTGAPFVSMAIRVGSTSTFTAYFCRSSRRNAAWRVRCCCWRSIGSICLRASASARLLYRSLFAS
jgi:hypothetical protein